MRSVAFTVQGKPATAGSKRGFINRKSGKVMMVDTCKRGPNWRNDVRAAFNATHEAMMEGPLALVVTFYLDRPKAHWHKDGSVREKFANARPITKPDSTKLVRAIEDALNGIAWKDDAQIVDQKVLKHYVRTPQSPAGAYVTIRECVE